MLLLGGLGLFLHAGPAIAFKLDCKVALSENSTTITSNCGGLDPDPVLIKSTDLGLVLGAGVDVGRAKISARCELGLSNVDASAEGSNAKYRSIVFLVGGAFRSPR